MKLPLPTILKDTLTGDFLVECLLCKKNVLSSGEPYALEKAMKRFPELDVDETIFEYCICQSCHEQSRKELSVKSQENIKSFFSSHQQALLEHGHRANEIYKVEELFERCLITQKPLEDLNGYQLFAHCQGQDILVNHGAFMLSDIAIEQIAQLISQKTRDHLNDFMDENFGLPPELKKKLADSPILAL